ncbi:hypothetical protein [Streptomyces sp. NRRL B-24484]|uniref:hypothetical protein n=1 Tax=Streptomyces sp. NRRL B-24484 TaxID=1463833 RepID=UPI0004C1D693|nr:hypothetical protein [Streptomyces sp. NRRL B-24484]
MAAASAVQETVQESVQEFIAVRTPAEIDRAALAAEVDPGPEAGGAAAAYRWVLDPGVPAPVTGTVHGELADGELAAEERAAILAARDTARPAEERRRALGAAEALGWVLGFAPLDD